MKKRIMLVDNDADFVETWADILTREGYEILTATSAEQAEAILARTWVHLMIVDMRLRNDNDRKDTSGLTLAKKEAYRRVRKIILTRYPHHDFVRSAMKPKDGIAPAVDFLDKVEGKQGVLRAVAEAFDQHVLLNWDLAIRFSEQAQVSFLRMAELIDSELDPVLLAERAQELEDLFRRLFPREKQVRIDKLLWQDTGRVALRVFAFAGRAESFVVVCGDLECVEREREDFQACSASTANALSTRLHSSVSNLRFSANAYLLAEADLENVRSLAELYRSGPDKTFNKALEGLYQETLAPCFNEKYLSEEWDSLGKLGRARLGLGAFLDQPEEFEQRLRVIAAQAPRVDAKVESARGKLNFHFGQQSFSYPDPLKALQRNFEFPLLVNAPMLSVGERILTDAAGKVWLTDFAGAGPLPLAWNFTALEAQIRFDWVETAKPLWLYEFEKCLTGDFTRFDTSDLEAPLRQAARGIQALRKLAGVVIGRDSSSYYWGLLAEALRRFNSFNPAAVLTRNELTRLLHALLAAAVISDKLAQPVTRAIATGSDIQVDKENHLVLVRGQRVRMRGLGYELLCLLNEQPGQLFKPRELVEQVFKETYREKDNDQINRLYVAVRRLRQIIETDPDNPRHLLNEPGGGYRLINKPNRSAPPK